MTAFADLHLGKGVVVAKDSPNFIGNHIALYAWCAPLALVAAGAYTIEEIDAITGPAIGRPKSATFRTLDLAGIDILAHVVRNLRERLDDPAARATFVLPPFVEAMLGQRAGRARRPARASTSGSRAPTASRRSSRSIRPRSTYRPAVAPEAAGAGRRANR